MSGPNFSVDPVEVAALDPAVLQAAVENALASISSVGSIEELKALRPPHLGDKSAIALASREIGALPPSAKADAGKRVGRARAAITEAFQTRQLELETLRDEQILVLERIDLTASGDRRPVGARHPISAITERIEDIFVSMGWEIAEGPELESEWLSFDALNIGPDHPARGEQDTFYIAPESSGLVLRPHTSPVQIRTMLDREPPIYVLCPGTVYRTDDLDATHSPVFHQFEGLVVDEGITMAHLRGTLDAFAQRLFGDDIVTRLRPNYFPFTEPSAEPDCQCWVCRGTDPRCRTCGGTGWVELGGSGMINHRVLRAAGIDPQRYSGFAFGIGIDRSLMLRHGIADMHDIVEGDVRFSRQFGMEL